MEERVVEGLNWKTQNKNLIVVNRNPYGFMHFMFKEGGALPQELSGAYTSMSDVQKAGDNYIKRMPRTHNADKNAQYCRLRSGFLKRKWIRQPYLKIKKCLKRIKCQRTTV